MRHERFAERTARHLEAMADELQEKGRRLEIDGRISARANEMRVAALVVRDVSAAVSQEESLHPYKGPKMAGTQAGW